MLDRAIRVQLPQVAQVGVTAAIDAVLRVDERQPPQDVESEKAMLGAMLLDERAVEDVFNVVEADDLYRPVHRIIFAAITDMFCRGDRPDTLTVGYELQARGQLVRAGGAPYLVGLIDGVPTAANALFYAEKVVEMSRRRRVVEAGVRLVQLGHLDGQELESVLERARQTLAGAAGAAATKPRALELDAFLAQDVPDYDWLIPGLIERQERTIVTAVEGGGKSTLLRQIGVQAASGVHPFGGEPFKPLRVLQVDLENSEAHVRRKVGVLRRVAGSAYGGGLHVEVRPQGIDLLDAQDARWLRELVETASPDVLITGPLYRLAGGDPTEEIVAKAVSSQMDRIRVEFGCAVLLEAHVPYGNNGGKRPERPYGASLWSRWPEFGIYLDADSGQLRHWRGARDERDWPSVLKRGGEWPWTVDVAPRAEVWARVVEECIRVAGRPTIRALVEAIGASKGTIERAINDHRGEWDGMA